MLTEIGQIVTLDGRYALIDVQRKSSCQSCAAKSGCGTSILSRFFEKRFSFVRAVNDVQASEGDVVELELNESALVFMTFWTYLFPILFMFSVILFATWFSDNSSLASIFGVAGLIAGIYISRRFVRRRLDEKQLHPVISKIVNS